MASTLSARDSSRQRSKDDGRPLHRPQRPQRVNLVPGVGVVSHLPLQMSLFFNTWYSPFWFAALIVALVCKFSKLQLFYQYTTIAVYVAMVAIEAGRLYLGYEGNLREKVPELAGFWLLSLLQLPLVVYLMVNVNTVILPLEWAVNIPIAAFILFEIVVGLRAMHLMTRAQAVKFQISQIHPALLRQRKCTERKTGKDGPNARKEEEEEDRV